MIAWDFFTKKIHIKKLKIIDERIKNFVDIIKNIVSLNPNLFKYILKNMQVFSVKKKKIR